MTDLSSGKEQLDFAAADGNRTSESGFALVAMSTARCCSFRVSLLSVNSTSNFILLMKFATNLKSVEKQGTHKM